MEPICESRINLDSYLDPSILQLDPKHLDINLDPYMFQPEDLDPKRLHIKNRNKF